MKKLSFVLLAIIFLLPGFAWAGSGPVQVLVWPRLTVNHDCTSLEREGYSWYNSTSKKYVGCRDGALVEFSFGEILTPEEINLTLDDVCANGTDCAFTSLPISRAFIIAPNALPGPQERTYHVSGDFIKDFIDGTTGLPGQLPEETIAPGNTRCPYSVTLNDPPEQLPQECVTVTETGGIGDGVTLQHRGTFASMPASGDFVGQKYEVIDCLTSLCAAGGGTAYGIVQAKYWNGSAWVNATPAWQVSFTMASAIADGVNCVKAASPAQINSGPNATWVACSDAAGTIEIPDGIDLPARYDGGALSICFRVNDDTDTDSVWDAAVIAQFRGAAAVVNNTWSSAAEAKVTLATADANYYACASLTPNGAAAGVGALHFKLTIDNAGDHTDTDGRVLGGYVTGF